MTYHVVLFEDGLAVVPNNWLSTAQDVCFYPTGISNHLIERASKDKEIPDVDSTKIKWKMFDVQRIFSSTSMTRNILQIVYTKFV